MAGTVGAGGSLGAVTVAVVRAVGLEAMTAAAREVDREVDAGAQAVSVVVENSRWEGRGARAPAAARQEVVMGEVVTAEATAAALKVRVRVEEVVAGQAA